MPINFVTGKPRNGKSVWTIQHVIERAKKENRPVYYCNIPELKIDGWIEIKHPNDWLDVPDTAIIIVDELQDFWGELKYATLSKEARYDAEKKALFDRTELAILELSKHGKRGIDFYFITQDPSLVVLTARKLCEIHYHVIRAFGFEGAMLYKYRGIQTSPELKSVKDSGEKTAFKFPKDIYKLYKSADVHNIKRNIPLKVLAIPVGLLLAGGMLYTSYYLLTNKVAKPAVLTDQQKGNSPGQASPGQTGAKHQSPQEFFASYVPRIEGLPHTAERYDEVTKPTIAPYPAACMVMRGKCRCFSQQATKIDTPHDLCMQIVQGGFFMDWPAPPPVQQATYHAKEGDSPAIAKYAGSEPVKPAQMAEAKENPNTHAILAGRKDWTARFSDTPTLSILGDKK